MKTNQSELPATPRRYGKTNALELLKFWQTPNQNHWLSEKDAHRLYGLRDFLGSVGILVSYGYAIEKKDSLENGRHVTRYKLKLG